MWNDILVSRLQLVLALCAVGLVGWGCALARAGREGFAKRERDYALLFLGGLGALAYANFGHLHFGNFIHAWDTYHYYLGSKYFPELGYDRLYDCTAVADAEGGLREQVARRTLTDLRTNLRVGTQDLLEHPERCKASFSPQRWSAFTSDLAWFRGRVSASKWEMMQHDHGYNATPVWNIAGHALSSLAPASDTQVLLLNLIDPLLLLAMAAMIQWAFDLRVLAVVLLVFGTGYPHRFYWTGGAFLRHDWLFLTVASVCLLRKQRPALAGFALAYATALRLFPAFLAVGPLLLLAERWRTTRRLDSALVRFFGAALVSGLLLGAAGAALSGGPNAYQRFFQNTAKHAATPLTNHMGLKTVLSYRPAAAGSALRDMKAIDPWGLWKQARLSAFAQVKWLFVALALGAVCLLYFSIRGPDVTPWMAAALSATLIAVGAELTCYYYCFMLAVALLHQVRREVGLVLLGFVAATQVVAWAPLPGMARWEDDVYVAMSCCALLALGAVLWLFTERGRAGALPLEPALALAPQPPSRRGPAQKKHPRR